MPDTPAQQRIKSQQLRSKALDALGSKCVECGYTDVRALQIDHKDGCGRAERRELKSNRNAQNRRVIAHPELYQCLCANCNWIKRVEQGEYKARPT